MSRSQRIVFFVLFVCALGGLLYSLRNYTRAFPEAEIPIRLSRARASELVDSILAAKGVDISTFRRVTVMLEEGKLYLDKEFGPDTIIALHTRGDVAVWFWTRRYFVPGRKEEYVVSIRPDDGRLVSFEHVVPETLSGADISSDSARAIAEAFLAGLGYNLSRWEPKKSQSERRPNRRDHTFTYELRGWSIGEAKRWVEVGVLGDEVGSFRDFLHVPEGWWRDFRKLRSSNELFQTVALLAALILFIALLGYLFFLFRRGLAWRFGAAVGLLIFFVSIAGSVNLFPLALFGYDTAESWAGFVFRRLFGALLSAAVNGLLAFVAAVSGERIYRQYMSGFSYLPQLLSPRGWSTAEFRWAVLAGYLLAAAQIGFIVAFYVIGKRLGFWTPTDTNYTNLLSTYLPWLFALVVGLQASVVEEFIFRLFGVPFLSKLAKSRVLGVIVPAFVWGFLHSNYPQLPGYVRGVEVGLVGVAFGLIFLRYGVVATLVSHFVFDAALVGVQILRQPSAVNAVFIVGVVLVPAGLVALGYLFGRRGEVARCEDMLPPQEPSVVEEAAPPPVPYTPLKRGKVFALLVAAAVGLVVSLAAPSYPHGRFRITRGQAIAAAERFLEGRGVGTEGFRKAATPQIFPGGLERRYVYQRQGWFGVFYNWGERGKAPFAGWRARFFIPEEKNQYYVYLAPDGDVFRFEHWLEEGDSGATIPQDSAYSLSVSLLQDFDLRDVVGWELVERTSEKRPKRMDHCFVWQSPDSIGEACWRARVEVVGDEPTGPELFLKLPEWWERRQRKTTLISALATIAPLVVVAVWVFVVVVAFAKGVSAGMVKPKALLWVAVAAGGAKAISAVNKIPAVVEGYYTVFPLGTYYTIRLVESALGVIFSAAAAAVCVGAFMSTSFGERLRMRVPAWENIAASIGALFVLAGVGAFVRWVELAFNVPLANPPVLLPPGFDGFVPALAVVDRFGNDLFLHLPALFVAYSFLRARASRGTLAAVAVLAAVALGAQGTKTLPELAWGAAKGLLWLGVGWALVRHILRDALPLYISVAFSARALEVASKILTCAANPFYIVNGVAVASLGAAALVLTALSFAPRELGPEGGSGAPAS